MLLVIDVGNTNTVLGVFARVAHVHPGDDVTAESARYERLVANWRVGSHLTRTVDEYGIIFRNLFAIDNLEVTGVHGIIISSVVPPLDPVLRQVCERYFNTKPLFIEPGIKTGMPVLYDNPAEVGADRIVNAVAAFEKYGGPCVIVDFGTATTFDCVSKKGEYMGGVICPGIGISADALFQRTARLPRVEVRKPARVIGTTTVGSLQSGLYYGYLGLVDGILARLVDELGEETRVVATGGLGTLIGTASGFIKEVDELLTLDGLRIIWDRNQTFRREATAKGAKAPAKSGDGNAKPWPSPPGKTPKGR
jgi:type III pantothenate kinase